MDFANDFEIINKINAGGGKNLDVDDELAELEAELNGPNKNKNKKKKKGDGDDLSLSDLEDDEEDEGDKKNNVGVGDKKQNKSDDELENLEKEGLDGLDEDDEDEPKKETPPPKPKIEEKKVNPKPPQPQVQNDAQKKIKEQLSAQMIKKKPEEQQQTKGETKAETNDKKKDPYPEKPEGKYHSVEKMFSLGVLKNEKELCDSIIEFKKGIGEDYDTWEMKKDSIDTKTEFVMSSIQDGVWDFNTYKTKIFEQGKWENKLLIFVTKDPTLKDFEKEEIKKRVQKRLEIIKNEMTQQVDEGDDEGEEEENQEEKKEEEPKKEEPKKEEPKGGETKKDTPKEEKLEKKESINLVLDFPKEKEQEEIKRLTQVVTERLNEYRAAIDYFKTNDLSEQQGPAIQLTKEICIELKKLQEGKWKEVNEYKLPEPITPKFIYGYSEEERKKRFTKIITEIFNQKKATAEELNKKIDEMKKMGKGQLSKMKDQIKANLDRLKSRKEKYEKILNLLKIKFQDKWVPAPLFVETQEEERIEKINEDIPENTVRITFGKTDYEKKKLDFELKLEGTDYQDKFAQKGKGDISHTTEWKMEKPDFKGFFKKKIFMAIYEKKLLSHKLKGGCIIEPRQLKTQSTFSNKFKVALESKRFDPFVEVTFNLRQPCHDPEYEIITKTSFSVTKIFPSFKGEKGDSAIKLDVPAPKVSAEDLKVSKPKVEAKPPTVTQKPPVTKKPSPAEGKQPAAGPKGGKKAPALKGPKIDKSEFKEEELEDPDFIDSLNSLQVLQFKLDKLEEKRAKIDGRTPRELMTKICKIKCKMNVLNDSFGDTIGPDDYLAMLKTSFDHDKRLAEYFAQNKEKEKSLLVSERLPVLLKEMEALIKQMKK